jgi:peptidyl-tRNA hydrolase
MAATLVQYVVVRKDLLKVLKWSLGAIITQACHACSAVIHIHHDDSNTQAYLADVDHMHKIILEVLFPEVTNMHVLLV